MNLKIWSAIAVAAFGWGTTGVATRAALLDGVPPIGMVAIRAVLATIVLYLILSVQGKRISSKKQKWQTGFIAGVFQFSLPLIFFTISYQYASAGFVGLLTALIPLGTATAAHFMLHDEKLDTAKVIGLSVALAGVAVLLISGNSGLENGGSPLLAAIFTLAAVISISLATVSIRGRADIYDPTELSFMQYLVGAVVVLGAMFIAEGLPGPISTWGWTMIVYTTIAGNVVPALLFYWLLQRVSSTKASLVGYVIPVIALSTGVLLLDEKLQIGLITGGALILIGLVMTDHAESAPKPIPRP